MDWRKDKRFDSRHGWNLWLTDDDALDIKKKWEGKPYEVNVERFNCGTIRRVTIKPIIKNEKNNK